MIMNRSFALYFLLPSLLLGGCANQLKMPLQAEDESQVSASPPIFLMTVAVKNNYKDRYQPEPLAVQVAKTVDGKEEILAFKMDSDGTFYGENEDQPPKFFARLQLEPGSYVLRGIPSIGKAFPIVGFFYVPLHTQFAANDPGFFYLGSVNAIVRERQGDEFKAGPTIPLIDQAVAGASGGTFEVEISDRYDEDIPTFRKLFPALKGHNVAKSILPPFDRGTAQAWWEAH